MAGVQLTVSPSDGASRLLAWFDRHGRDLPWRKSRDPYRVWVSEIMLQQTQVDRVKKYYDRFLEAFPTVEALASADIHDVLARWSGLGYYRRARFLHQAAGKIVALGTFPTTADSWQRLPGVGRYTAAAVASIAFSERIVALDANAERILARIGAVVEDPRTAAGRRELIATAERLLDPRRPGDSNQAMMDLGAVVCRPTAPRCALCPLERDICRARRHGRVEHYPVRTGQASRRVQEDRIGVCCVRGDRILLVRRSESAALLAGMWEIPWVPWRQREEAERLLAATYGGRWQLVRPRGWVRHAITFRDIRLEVWEGHSRALDRVADGAESSWHELASLDRLPLSSLVTKAVRKLNLSPT